MFCKNLFDIGSYSLERAFKRLLGPHSILLTPPGFGTSGPTRSTGELATLGSWPFSPVASRRTWRGLRLDRRPCCPPGRLQPKRASERAWKVDHLKVPLVRSYSRAFLLQPAMRAKKIIFFQRLEISTPERNGTSTIHIESLNVIVHHCFAAFP